ncbi:hypothetical protein DPSP01_004221 [Paraphaeosphaeria sporulosa]|uniref:DUF4336 domain-containing protein n=1 Tax=Paraphaeosphaeria sporulosa TaxID=1460663 RepID=A0A177CBK0_9PLEO|nr:uncharacterized protein CC84DRAFT_1165010 [Paraphaeosphaeria sporulosa]OAG04571.1 hypothetical protein CC84DRAFT_1165010 [Paraphaeosphaeria sporulosa]
MSSKLVPSNPAEVMVIRDIVPRTITTLSVPFARFGRIKVGGRGTIVRLQNGSLAVFSPVALTDEVKQKVAEMGEVKYITALDIEHHIFLGPWHAAYPNAQVLGPEGLPEKRKSQNKEAVPFAHLFSKDKPVTSIDPDFDREFEWEYVPAHTNKEIVFNHKPTRTLIEADLMFNYPSTEQYSKTGLSATSGVLTKIFGMLTNTSGKGQQRAIWYGISSRDRAGFSRSVSKIHQWDFDRIIPCHGDVLESGGKGIFAKVMEWHLELAKKRS